jgi:hypothetical protein
MPRNYKHPADISKKLECLEIFFNKKLGLAGDAGNTGPQGHPQKYKKKMIK